VVGQISRDIGIKFTTKSPYLVTHEISQNLDEARHYIVEDLVASNAVEKIGYVRVSEPTSLTVPARTSQGTTTSPTVSWRSSFWRTVTFPTRDHVS